MKKSLSIIISLVFIHTFIYAQQPDNEFGYAVMPDVVSTSTDPVGSPAASFSVSPMGAAVYSVPIEVPKGIGGMQPEIAITYNSQSGNSLVGYGCSISGISVITRGARDIYHDGHAEGVSFTNDDAFYLDGQRLVRQSSSTLGDSIEYCLENNPFVRVVMYDANSLSKWFKVEDTNGNISSYSTRLIGYGLGLGNASAWYLSRLTNPIGNYIQYNYQIQGYVRVSSILYGGNRIEFEYENRPDTVEAPIPGGKTVLTQRLKAINTYNATGNGESRIMRTYAMSYNTTSDYSTCKYSRLMSINLSNASGEEMRPITLGWNFIPSFSCQKSEPVMQPSIYTYGATRENMAFIASDINNDGLCDILQMARSNVYNTGYNFLRVYYAQLYNGNQVRFVEDHIIQLGEVVDIDDFFKNKYTTPFVMDVDTDRVNEIVQPIFQQISDESVRFGLRVFKYGTEYGHTLTPNLHVDDMDKVVWCLADFNNDGIGEVAVIEKAKEGSSAYYGSLIGGYNEQNMFSRPFRFNLPYDPIHTFAADMNNDGMTDVVVFYEYGYRIFWNDGSWLDDGTSTKTPTYTSYTLNKFPKNVWQGDFNGDGICDFLLFPENDTRLYFEIGDGQGGLTEKTACNLSFYDRYDTDKDDGIACFTTDMDGDGKTDVFINKGQYRNRNDHDKNYTYWLRSNGHQLILQKRATSWRKLDSDSRYYVCGDFDGNGIADIASLSYDCYDGNDVNEDPVFRIYKNANYQSASGKATSFTNGFNTATFVEYKPMTDCSVYSKGNETDLPFPVMTLTPALPAVASTMTSNGAAGISRMNYTYEGLKIHAQGRGMLGMTATTETSQNTGLSVESRVTEWNEDTYLPSQTVETQSLGGLTATKTTDFQTRFSSDGMSFFYKPKKVIAFDFDGNKTHDEFTYDQNHGGELWIDYHELRNTAKQVSYYYFSNKRGGRYLPDSVIVWKQYGAPTTDYAMDSVAYSYNDKGQVLTQMNRAGTALTLTTNYTYDDYGNMITKQTSGNNVETVTTRYEYDSATHRFLTKSVENNVFEKRYTYDTWGNMLTETDRTRTAYPLTTSYEYDGWGNLIREISPTGQLTTYIQGWGSTAIKKYFTLKQGTKQPWVLTWYDQCGREVRKETIGAKDLLHTTTMTYNTRGLLSGKTILTKSNGSSTGTSLSETITYDERGRVEKDIFDGTETSYTYSGNTTTVTKGGRSVATKRDPMGNTLTVTDPSGTVTYDYDGNLNPKSVTAHGSTVSMEYDEAGNQKKLIDPDAGTQLYTYDAYGRIVSQRDGKGVTTTNTYNELGQLIQSETGTVITSFTYGQQSQDRGLLLSSSRQGNTVSYGYDHYGRVTSETYSVSGLSDRQFSYSYNYDGMLATVIYPDSVMANYGYDSYGNRVSISVGGNPLWRLSDNSPTTTIYWLGTSTWYTKINDKRGRTTMTCLGNNPTGSTYGSLSYTYDDATDNMMTRTGMFSEQETFTYDNLDRLTGIQYDDQQQHSVSYSPNGNIDRQTGIGRYFYDSTKPHAVTGVENTGLVVPLTPLRTVYNPFGKIATMADDGSGYQMTVDYGPDNERWKSQLTYLDTLKRTTYYLGDYEEIVENDTTRRFYYLGNNVVYVRQTGLADKVLFMLTDHLGSVVNIVDESGNSQFSATYDAWGNQAITRNHIGFHRGYTGHEMLPEFGLINMNGRLYDPAIGRFLSTDSYVQEPGNSQSFNRYSYCLNNPLKYTDPDGELFWNIIIGGVIGGTINLVSKAINGQIGSFTDGLMAFGNGFVSGSIASVSGGAALAYFGGSTSIASGLASGVFSSVFSLPALSIGNSAYFGDPIMGASDYIKGVILGGVAGAVTNAVSNVLSGKNIWTGKTTPKLQKVIQLPETESTPIFNSNISEEYPKLNTIGNLDSDLGLADDVVDKVVQSQTFPMGEGNVSVYVGTDNNNIRYVGISNNPDRRFLEHLRSATPKSDLQYRIMPEATNLTRIQSRIVEQNLINTFKTNGQLFNKINSIAPRYWNKYGIEIKIKIPLYGK